MGGVGEVGYRPPVMANGPAFGSEKRIGGGLERTKSEALAEEILSDVDPWTAWMYQPQTALVTLAGAGLIMWSIGLLNGEEQLYSTVTNTKRGVWAMIAVFICYCLLQAPPTILVRPHPVFWRFVHGISAVYLIFLTFLLYQNRDDARQLLKHLHPDLGVPLQERPYAEDCRVYTPEKPNKFSNIFDAAVDEYALAHTIGWWAKAIMVRNEPFLWCLSIVFELAERSLIFMLANFKECWWDSFVLDALICNWFGIWAGMKTVRYFDGKTYNWVGLSQQKSLYGKVKRTLGQFTPSYWDKDEWNALQGPWRFIQVLGLGVVIEVVEVMGFFLKYILWITPANPINIYRMAIWWLIANPAIREYNDFLQTRAPVKKLGAFCWLALCIATMETLICVRFGQGLFKNPVPKKVIWFWSLTTLALVLFLGGWTYKTYKETKKAKDNNAFDTKSKKSL